MELTPTRISDTFPTFTSEPLELPHPLPTQNKPHGSSIANASQDLSDSSASLASLDSVVRPSLEDHSTAVSSVTVTTTPPAVKLKADRASVSTTLLEIPARDVPVDTMVMLFKELRRIVRSAHVPTTAHASFTPTEMFSVLNARTDTLDVDATNAQMDSTETRRRASSAKNAPAPEILIQTLLEIATRSPESVRSVFSTLTDSTAKSARLDTGEMLSLNRKEIVSLADAMLLELVVRTTISLFSSATKQTDSVTASRTSSVFSAISVLMDSTTLLLDLDARNATVTQWDRKETLAMLSLDSANASQESLDNVVTNAPHTTLDSAPTDANHVTVNTLDRKANSVMSIPDNACAKRTLKEEDAISALRTAMESPKDACHATTATPLFRPESTFSERKSSLLTLLFKKLSRTQLQSTTPSLTRRSRKPDKLLQRSGKLSSRKLVSWTNVRT